MFGETTNDNLKGQEKNKTKNKNHIPMNQTKVKHYSTFLKNQFLYNGLEGDIMNIITKLPTYKKINILQSLLKKINSIKERLEDNIDKLLENISNNCFYYYKSKIEMKEIYDYCQLDNKEINLNYTLCENTKEKLSKDYKILYDVLFLLRENYNIMILIINNCNKDSFESLADFIVNFFYENTVNSSFNEEELIILIYLLMENLILNKMPDSFNSFISNNYDIFGSDFLSYIFKYITRKVDVRNFTCMILSANIIKLEELNIELSISVQVINENSNSNSNRSSFSKKLNIVEQTIPEILDDFIIVQQETPNSNMDKSSSPIQSILLNNPDETQEQNINNNENNNDFNNNTYTQKRLNYIFPEINSFFYENDVTSEFLNSELLKYENKEDIISLAMVDYLDLQINQISIENTEIFCNCVRIVELKNYLTEFKKEKFNSTMNVIIDNYSKITNFIDEILYLFKNNITSMSYILKSIGIIIEILLNKKLEKKQKPKKYDYIKLMILSNFFFGKILLPLIENPDFNGIITTAVISKITRDNLKLIHKIIITMLSGKLFSNQQEFEFTIFNKYIIETLPKIFDIINSIHSQKNFQLPNKIQKLIRENNSGGNIEYDYFKENQENIRQQSVCFSLENINIMVNSVRSCIELFTNEKYSEYNILFQNFIKLCYLIKNKEINNIRNQDYFLIEKIDYSPSFKNLINNISQENIFAIMPNFQNDELSIFKNCLVELLAYVKILNKEHFNHSMQKKKKVDLPFEQKIKKLYNNIIFDDSQKIKSPEMFYLKDFYSETEKENKEEEEIEEFKDSDFKKIIFPQIIDIAKSELSYNLDTVKAKRIVFCSSYLQIHIENLPVKYTENNYNLLLIEVIQKSEEIIQVLNLSILNNYYSKVKGGDKLNMIISSNLFQIKKIEKWVCIEYLFEKINLPCKLVVIKENSIIITKLEYKQIDPKSSYINSISSFIKNFHNFRKYEKEEEIDDIVELEEKVGLDIVLNDYFKDLKNLIKKEIIIERFTKEEQEIIMQELENYILLKLYDKLFPKNSNKYDLKFYKKCCRLDFIKPENLIKDKKVINENLWKTPIAYIKSMDEKLTPQDKVKNFGKAVGILNNSITFSSGKKDLGIDDTINILTYIILKAKPKNISTNNKYCQLLLNPGLAMKEYGILLSQMEMVKNIIYDMKYTDLIEVSEEQFGKDDE